MNCGKCGETILVTAGQPVFKLSMMALWGVGSITDTVEACNECVDDVLFRTAKWLSGVDPKPKEIVAWRKELTKELLEMLPKDELCDMADGCRSTHLFSVDRKNDLPTHCYMCCESIVHRPSYYLGPDVICSPCFETAQAAVYQSDIELARKSRAGIKRGMVAKKGMSEKEEAIIRNAAKLFRISNEDPS